MRVQSPVVTDPELGEIRRCPGCGEWWPDDDEFFYSFSYEAGELAYANGRPYVRNTSGVTRRCKACHVDSNRRSRKRASLRRANESRRTVQGFCRMTGCPVRVPAGRTECHGCAGRVTGALTPERIRALLHPMDAAA